MPIVAGVVGVKPEARLRRLNLDEAHFVVRVVFVAILPYSFHTMLLDNETLENGVLRRTALRHDDIRAQHAQFSRDKATAVLEQRPVSLASVVFVLAALRAVDVGEIEPRIGYREACLERAEKRKCQLVGAVPMLVLGKPCYVHGEVLTADLLPGM